jgi:hypothetical protein
MSKKVVVSLGRSVPFSVVNRDQVMKKAVALAEQFLLPAGVEFASFEHAGRTYALSAALSVEVDCLDARVPAHVIREGGLVVPKKVKRRFPAA